MQLKCLPFLRQTPAHTWCKFSYFINSELTLGVKFIFIISLMHILSNRIKFVQRKPKPEDIFMSKTERVHAKQIWHSLICTCHQDSYAPLLTQELSLNAFHTLRPKHLEMAVFPVLFLLSRIPSLMNLDTVKYWDCI